MPRQFIYILFRFEYNSKGVPVEKLIVCSTDKQLLINHHKTHFSTTAKQNDFSAPLVRRKPREVAVFSRNGGPYFGYYIDERELLSTTPQTKRKPNTSRSKS